MDDLTPVVVRVVVRVVVHAPGDARLEVQTTDGLLIVRMTEHALRELERACCNAAERLVALGGDP